MEEQTRNMDNTDKQEILAAITALTAHVDERIGGLDERMGSLEDRMGNLTQEMRSGFAAVDTRLCNLEETVSALSTTIDKQLEDNVLGKGNITLTRREYDVLVEAHDLPNRYAMAGSSN
jgi:hypothetical protein